MFASRVRDIIRPVAEDKVGESRFLSFLPGMAERWAIRMERPPGIGEGRENIWQRKRHPCIEKEVAEMGGKQV